MTDTTCIAKNCGHGKPRLARAGLLCNACHDRLERDLAETPALVTQIRQEFIETGSGAESDGSKHTKGEPPAPGSINAISQLIAYEYVLASWVTMITEQQNLRGPDRWNDPAQTSRWLLTRAPWIAAQPWVNDLIDEVRHAMNGLRIITGEFVPTTDFSHLCPHCSKASLRGRFDRESGVWCTNEDCRDEQGNRIRWPHEDLGRLAAMLEAQNTNDVA